MFENVENGRDTMKKRFLAIVLSMALAAACLTACEQSEQSSSVKTTTTTTTQTEATTTTVETEQTTEETEPEPPKAEVKNTTITVNFKNNDGYKFTADVSFTPWMLQSKYSDEIDAAMKSIGVDKLPGIQSFGVTAYSDNLYKGQISVSERLTRGVGFHAHANDWYYSFGTIQIKNATENFDITSDRSVSPELKFMWTPEGSEMAELGGTLMPMGSKTYYSNSDKYFLGGLRVNPKMTKNTTGKIPIVLIHAENFTPNSPNGEYHDETAKASLIAAYSAWDSENNQRSEISFNIPIYGEGSSSQQTDINVETPSSVKSPKDLVALTASVYKKDLETAANTVAKVLNANLAKPLRDEYADYDSLIYEQKSSRINVLGVDMFKMCVDSFRGDRDSCVSVAFYQNYSGTKEAGLTAAQAKSAYDKLYKQFQAAYGEPTDNVEKEEKDREDKSDYSKYYWVEWDTPEGNVWLCWGADLWEMEGYNDCTLSISHRGIYKQ